MAQEPPVNMEKPLNGDTGAYPLFHLVLQTNADASSRGCVTPEILTHLAAVQLHHIIGFDSLK